jgi:hypothetical protein
MPGQRETAATDAPATAATASANPDGACAGGTGSTPTSTSSLMKNARTRPAREPNRRSHPPDSVRRPAPRSRDRPGTRPGRLRRQGRPDHLGQIHPPQQREHRKKHVRPPAPAAASPPRPQPHQPAAAPQHPRPGPPPPGPHTATARALKLPARQPPLDLNRVRPYREH